ncbi:MAG: hypothetical protein Q7U39_04320 [Nitrospira sp.]|nr:hypothetical protein [Nitrospira sp.]
MSDDPGESRRFVQAGHDRGAGEGAAESAPRMDARSTSIVPLIVLFQRAWELAHSTEMSLARLEHAAEAGALAEAMLHLLAEAGDEEGQARWAVRLSEVRHWCAVVHDALSAQEEKES